MFPELRDRGALLVLLASAALFLPGLGNHDLWNPDEPRYAQVAKEMRQSGEYLVPQLNGEIYSQKPPLFFWSIVATSFLTGGVDELSARLPSAMAAIGSILLVFALGRRLFGGRAAWFAAAAFATNVRVLWQGRTGQIDMLLTFLVCLGVYFWVRGYDEDRTLYYRLFFVAAGLATLAKGPVGLLPPLLSIVAFLLWTRNFESLRRFRIGSGLLLWTAVVLAWLVPAGIRAGWAYVEQIAFSQTVTRYLNPGSRPETIGHLRPWYYYLRAIFIEFFPWSFYLPLGVVAGLRWQRDSDRRWPTFLLSWIVVTVVFFSLSLAKRAPYVLTAFPALALLVGWALDRLALRLEGVRWRTVPAALVAATAIAIVIGFPFLLPTLREAEVLLLSRSVAFVTLPFVPLAVGAVWSWRASQHGSAERHVVSLVAGIACTALIAFLILPQTIEPLKSARGLGAILEEKLDPRERFWIYPEMDEQFLFYSQRRSHVLTTDELADLADRSDPRWILAEKEFVADFDHLALEEVARDADPLNGFILYYFAGAPPP